LLQKRKQQQQFNAGAVNRVKSKIIFVDPLVVDWTYSTWKHGRKYY